jgi:plasmid stabilization system protein ParE
VAVRLHRAALADLKEARDWYEHARPGLGVSFVAEVERKIEEINAFPGRFPFHREIMQRASLRRFPFSIFFEEVGDTRYI